MSQVGVEARLTTGRTLKQGRGMELGKLSSDYYDSVAICEMDSTTLEVLGLEAGEPVRVESLVASVVVYSKLDRNGVPGVVFIPCGPYANAIMDDDTLESGMPRFKDISVKLFPAKNEQVLSVQDLLQSVTEGT